MFNNFESHLNELHLSKFKGSSSVVEGFASVDEPKENFITLIGSSYYLKKIILNSSLSKLRSILIVKKSIFEKNEDEFNNFENILISNSYERTVCCLSKMFYEKRQNTKLEKSLIESSQIKKNVIIGENCKIEKNVTLHHGVIIMDNVIIKEGCVLFPNVVIYPRVTIKENTRIHAGSVIGCDGFGYNFIDGEHQKIWHSGGVIIGENVEVGANTCIDSGTFLPTIIQHGTKIDNLSQIGHNANIGKHNIICGMSALGGSSETGEYTIMGGKAALGPSAKIGNNVTIAGGSMVNKNVESHEKVSGYPARNLKEWKKMIVSSYRLARGDK